MAKNRARKIGFKIGAAARMPARIMTSPRPMIISRMIDEGDAVVDVKKYPLASSLSERPILADFGSFRR